MVFGVADANSDTYEEHLEPSGTEIGSDRMKCIILGVTENWWYPDMLWPRKRVLVLFFKLRENLINREEAILSITVQFSSCHFHTLRLLLLLLIIMQILLTIFLTILENWKECDKIIFIKWKLTYNLCLWKYTSSDFKRKILTLTGTGGSSSDSGSNFSLEFW